MRGAEGDVGEAAAAGDDGAIVYFHANAERVAIEDWGEIGDGVLPGRGDGGSVFMARLSARAVNGSSQLILGIDRSKLYFFAVGGRAIF